MSKPTHTPGPWEHTGQGDIVGKEDNGYGLGYVDVCSVYLRTVRGRTNANALLIAAAPDLFDFAKYWLERQGSDINYMTEKARAAIAKATTGA